MEVVGGSICPLCGASSAAGGPCACPPVMSVGPESATRRAPSPRPAAIPGLDPGLLAGRYVLQGLLGRGGFGEVHEAEDLVLSRRVAIKFVPESAAGAAFEREARALARLRHPNLVMVHDVVADGSTRGLVLELVQGPSLATMVTEGGLALEARLRIAERICAAVEHAHDRGVLHGDLKPANVLIDADGRPRVTDFGTARLLDVSTSASIPAAFTMAYVAPERLAGERLTVAADVYSLGALIFDLVAGHPPFSQGTLDQLMRRIELETAPRLRSDVPSAPAELDALVAACLAKDPSARPPGARAVRLALERLIAPTGPMRPGDPDQAAWHADTALPSVSGERRRVLVLEVALRHLDDLREELAETEWLPPCREEMSAVTAITEAHGGLVLEARGASLTAVFGLRGRRDNEARHAAACAAEIVGHGEGTPTPAGVEKTPTPAGVEKTPTPAGVEGMATPRTVERRRIAVVIHAAHVISAGRTSAWALRDEVRRQGAALLEQAPDGEVLLTDDVVRAGRDAFATDPAGALGPSRGAERGVQLHRLAPERAPDLRVFPLEGRTHELAMALELLRAGLQGRSVLLTIEGPAGIGKTRLLEEILTRLGDVVPGLAVARTRSQHDEGAPRRVLSSLFASLERSGLVRAASHSLSPDELELLRGAERVGAPRASEERSAALTFAWTTLLDRARQVAPIVLVVEEAHVLPREARDILARLAEATRGMGIAWIFAHRQEFTAPWSGRPHHRPLVLGSLDEAAEARLVTGLLGGAPGPRLRELLRRNADGLPLHAIELARSLSDEGRLVSLGEEWEIEGDIEALTCPLSLQELLAARCAQVSAQATAILQCGAVLGAEFDLGLAARMSEFDGREVNAAACFDEIAGAELVVRVGHSGTACRFQHDIVRSVVLDGLVPARLRVLSGFAATALEESSSPGDLATDVLRARHLAASNEPERAAELAVSCAERLEEVGEASASLGLARLAVELHARLRRPPGERARALTALATAGSRLGEPDAIDWAQQAVESAGEEDNPALGARARLALGRALGRARDPRAAIEALESAHALAVEAGDHELAVTCRLEQLGPSGMLGDAARAGAILAELETAHSRAPEIRAAAIRRRARQLFLGGEHAEALRLVDEALARPGAAREAATTAHFLAQRCPILAAQGRMTEATAAAQEALAAAARAGLRPTQSYLRAFLAYAELSLGHLAAAEQHARTALALSARIGSRWDLAVAQRTHAGVLAELGDLPAAEAAFDAALAGAAELDAPALVAAVRVDRGVFLITCGDLDVAECELAAALEMLRQHPHQERQLRARAALRLIRRLRTRPVGDDLATLIPGETEGADGAWIALDSGQAQEAARRAREAARRAGEEGRRLEEVRALHVLAHAEPSQVTESCRRALEIARACEAPEAVADVLVAAARLSGEEAALAEARSFLRERAAALSAPASARYLARPDRAQILGL